MISYIPEEIIEDWPAFRYCAARPVHDYGKDEDGNYRQTPVIHVHAGDRFAAKIRGHYHQFTFGSTAAFAMEQSECPVAAIEKARETGQPGWWVIPSAVVITAHKRDKVTLPVVELGETVKFEGRYFELVPAANDNINLREIQK